MAEMSTEPASGDNQPAAAPAPADQSQAAAPAAAPAATPAPTAAPAADALLSKPTTPDPWESVPEKYRVKGEDGTVDQTATLAKLTSGYQNLAKRMGTGDVPPEKPDAYTYTPPEQFKDIPMDDAASLAFRDRAHKAGLTQAQYEMVMGEYFTLVPQVLNSAAQMTATEAKAELSKVWATPTEYESGIKAADRALSSAPEAIRDQLWEKYGRDPVFIRFAASIGKEMGEDRLSATSGQSTGGGDVDSLIGSEAYRNPKHPDHAAVSARVQRHFATKFGNQAAM
jgi:hypothetical protein